MARRRNHDKTEWPLPWPIELLFWVVGLVRVPLGMWWMTNEITSPATMFGQILGIEVDTRPMVEPFKLWILLFGLLVGWRVRCWLRRTVLRRLNNIV